MSEMIERVARAICEAERNQPRFLKLLKIILRVILR